MTGKKIRGFLTVNGRYQAVDSLIFEGVDGQIWASINGGIFNDWEANYDHVQQAIALLRSVADTMKDEGVIDAKSTK